ncbi:MAG TPA: hypothetical protein VGM76_10200 [Lacipirellulaceae bacterium]
MSTEIVGPAKLARTVYLLQSIVPVLTNNGLSPHQNDITACDAGGEPVNSALVDSCIRPHDRDN